MRKILAALIILPMLALAGCKDDAHVASQNISKAADNFEIVRQIVFYNTWTDTEVMNVVGFCSMEIGQARFVVICKDPDGFKKHYLGRNNNMTFFTQQLEGADVSVFHPRITWKPQGFIPDIDLRVDGGELVRHRDTSDSSQ